MRIAEPSVALPAVGFPFLFGGTFIEGQAQERTKSLQELHFPSFSEGLSLRDSTPIPAPHSFLQFPFLFGGTFIEGGTLEEILDWLEEFPFLFGGTFIEGCTLRKFRR